MRHLNYAPWSATTPPTFNLCQRQRKLYKNDNNNWKHGRYTFRFGANNRSAAAKEKRLVVQSGNGDNAFDMGNNTPPPAFRSLPPPWFPFLWVLYYYDNYVWAHKIIGEIFMRRLHYSVCFLVIEGFLWGDRKSRRVNITAPCRVTCVPPDWPAPRFLAPFPTN